ncbi:MAG: PQQ-binding-like beta-propeller repeat protein [Dehalococcoidia bacterium]|nr:PQQ-binding-like beta-propeller repeat protein [Dehalococcoidia bacterium]
MLLTGCSASEEVAEPSSGPGTLIWKYQTGDSIQSSPTVHEGVVYVGSWYHYLYAIDAASGELR